MSLRERGRSAAVPAAHTIRMETARAFSITQTANGMLNEKLSRTPRPNITRREPPRRRRYAKRIMTNAL